MKLYFLSFLFAQIILTNAASESLVNVNVERTVDVSSNVIYDDSQITVENRDVSGSQKSYVFTVDPNYSKNTIANVEAYHNFDKNDGLKVVLDSNNANTYIVNFKTPLAAGKSVKIEIGLTIINSLRPFPTEINQADRQLVLFPSNAYYFSIYPTTEQITEVKLASDKTESYTQVKPTNKQGSTITYGPYKNIPASERAQISIHYENNSPFLTVSDFWRSIEVSHWGNIAIEETVDIYHSGAKLRGSFSRFDYMRRQGGSSSVKSFKTFLPPLATHVYYRDEIGNISTSNLRTPTKRQLSANVPAELELRPRFPLFGGWKTQYTIGYNVPTYQYLFNKNNDYTLRIRLIDHLYDNQVIENAEIRIILPEYSTDIKLNLPYNVDSKENDVHYTYLDTVGRPTLILRRKNSVESHMRDFTITYKFQNFMILREPFLIVGFFYILFTVVILIVRLDFSLKPSVDTVQHSKRE